MLFPHVPYNFWICFTCCVLLNVAGLDFRHDVARMEDDGVVIDRLIVKTCPSEQGPTAPTSASGISGPHIRFRQSLQQRRSPCGQRCREFCGRRHSAVCRARGRLSPVGRSGKSPPARSSGWPVFPPKDGSAAGMSQRVICSEFCRLSSRCAVCSSKLVACIRRGSDDADLRLTEGISSARRAWHSRIRASRSRSDSDAIYSDVASNSLVEAGMHAQPIRHRVARPRARYSPPSRAACYAHAKFRAALGRADAAARALKNAEAERLLHVVQNAAQTRLPQKQISLPPAMERVRSISMI